MLCHCKESNKTLYNLAFTCGTGNLVLCCLRSLKSLLSCTTEAAVSSTTPCGGGRMPRDTMACRLIWVDGLPFGQKNRSNQILNITKKINGNRIPQHLLGILKSQVKDTQHLESLGYLIPKGAEIKLLLLQSFTIYQVKDASDRYCKELISVSKASQIQAPVFERKCILPYSYTVTSILEYKNALTWYTSSKQYSLSSKCELRTKEWIEISIHSSSVEEFEAVVSRCDLTVLSYVIIKYESHLFLYLENYILQ